MSGPLGVRWTIGDVSEQGFEALRLSICGAHQIFGDRAEYVVCVNSISVDTARTRTGALPTVVTWRDTTAEIPAFLHDVLDGGMAEGVAWKLAPLRCFPGRFELSLDNDCVLWSLPPALERWLALPPTTRTCLVAEDVRACFGRFAPWCGETPCNMGIRGLPPAFDLEQALRDLLIVSPGILASELDEQGLQLAALSQECAPLIVSVTDVSICSPFPPHLPDLGRCGAHFCGLNAKQLPWALDGRPATELVQAFWAERNASVRARVFHQAN